MLKGVILTKRYIFFPNFTFFSIRIFSEIGNDIVIYRIFFGTFLILVAFFKFN